MDVSVWVCVCFFFVLANLSRTHTHTLRRATVPFFGVFFFADRLFFARAIASTTRRTMDSVVCGPPADLHDLPVYGDPVWFKVSLSLSLSLSFSFSISLIQLDFGRSMERAVRLSDVPVWFFLFWLSHFPMTSRHQPLRIKQTKKLPSVSLTTVRKKTNKNKTLSSSRPDCHFALLKKKAVSISEADLARHLTGFETAIFFLSTDFSARTSSAGLCAFFCFLFTSFDGRSNRVPFLFFLATIRIPRAMFSCSFPRSQPTLSAQFSGHYVNGHFNFNAISFFFLPFKGGAGAGPRPSVQRIRSISTARRISSECPQQNELSLSLSLSFSLGPIPR